MLKTSLLAIATLVTYILLWPVSIDPVSWEAPANPGYTGDFEQNDLLKAIELIEEKLKFDREKIIKTFDEAPEIQILNGRYGPYIKVGRQNVKIPKIGETFMAEIVAGMKNMMHLMMSVNALETILQTVKALARA